MTIEQRVAKDVELFARISRRVTCLVVVLAAACGSEPMAAPSPKTALGLVNDLRSDAAVTEDKILTRTALAHAEEMARLGYFGHFSPTPGKRTPDDRLARHGWPPDRRYFELLTFANSPEEALTKWAAKPELKKELLDPKYKVAGVASASGRVEPDSERTYWVLLLGE